MNLSSLFSLNLRDLGKAILVVIVASLLASVKSSIESGALPTMVEFLAALKIAGFAGVAYLIKNLFTNNVDQVLSKDEDPDYGGGVKNPTKP